MSTFKPYVVVVRSPLGWAYPVYEPQRVVLPYVSMVYDGLVDELTLNVLVKVGIRKVNE